MFMNLDAYITQAYFILKLCFVFALGLYHLQCHVIYKQIQRGEFKYSSFALRMWNEVATLLLFAIVFIIVLKQNNSYIWAPLGVIILSAALFAAIKLYKKSREKNNR